MKNSININCVNRYTAATNDLSANVCAIHFAFSRKLSLQYDGYIGIISHQFLILVFYEATTKWHLEYSYSPYAMQKMKLKDKQIVAMQFVRYLTEI